MAISNQLSMQEACSRLRLPEVLVRDFTQYPFNERKLKWASPSQDTFDREELEAFIEHLDSPWPENKRESPQHVQRYLAFEARAKCALCHEKRPNYDIAHIVPWAKTRCHNPHNLLHLCLDCHRSSGEDSKLLRMTKDELLRQLWGQSAEQKTGPCRPHLRVQLIVESVGPEGLRYRLDVTNIGANAAECVLHSVDHGHYRLFEGSTPVPRTIVSGAFASWTSGPLAVPMPAKFFTVVVRVAYDGVKDGDRRRFRDEHRFPLDTARMEKGQQLWPDTTVPKDFEEGDDLAERIREAGLLMSLTSESGDLFVVLDDDKPVTLGTETPVRRLLQWRPVERLMVIANENYEIPLAVPPTPGRKRLVHFKWGPQWVFIKVDRVPPRYVGHVAPSPDILRAFDA